MEYKVNNLIYAAGSNMLGTIRTGITLTEPVNTQALENAVRKAAKRFPYFSVKLDPGHDPFQEEGTYAKSDPGWDRDEYI